MDCPRCGLINPNTALRCDCGYDFDSKTVEKSYALQQRPKGLRSYLIVVLVLGGLHLLRSLSSGDAIGLLIGVVWMPFVYWLYRKLVRKKNWARIALIVLTFPLGLWLVGSETRLYCLQSRD